MTKTEIPPSANSREATEHQFVTSDGTELFYRAWAPRTNSQKAIVLLHRGHEHSGRWQDLIDRIDLDDFWFFAWDARGHGRSPGERGYAESFGRLVRDVDEFVRHIQATFDLSMENTAVVAQSVGAVLAAAWVHDYAPPIRALVVATPAFRIKLYVPFAIPGLRVLNQLKSKSFIKSYVKPGMLTHDAEQAREYASDPLISPQIATNILLGLHDTSTRLVEDAGAIQTPTLMLISGKDWVVKRKPQDQFFERLSSPIKEKEVYPDFYHSTFWEQKRELPITRTREFLVRQFESAVETPDLLEEDQRGHSKQICAELEQPLSLASPKRWGFALQSIGMKTTGRLSRGIQVGWKTGFDSGESLDHVYRNTPEGITPLGRLIDHFYLNSPGWCGIRQRKIHMQMMLDRAIEKLHTAGEAIRIQDIASGPGRYILDTIRNHPEAEISALMCDRDVGGLEAGRTLAQQMQIDSVQYKESDAFSAAAITGHDFQPNIAIVSGLYELFPANAPLQESLKGLSDTLVAGGYLLYTNQPWHPQQEMIARVLPNRDGDPWVMRCRTQQEMDQLVSSVGFRKVDMLIDDEGIFSVSMAVKE
ncbi:bifunctional alpha/beta hydrolase/class I SAM-dependent methyltransferase [Gimesia fumaroli]|uniref:Phospholipase YtpA n=1 Tax=Gimesia fumaroli TaxID=2527976 RepID=A0A518IJU1_9PLAN|nr:bifunctional alpha/beta hydrolase/class I SAM-dependent methyltransferase [Gimesia fumaroli]QDV53367.1 Phospholipase YtpA [Gimesia fumaroli]